MHDVDRSTLSLSFMLNNSDFHIGQPLPQGNLHFDKAALQRLLLHFDHKTYPARREIFAPGDKADTLYYVISGSLALVSDEDTPDNKKSNPHSFSATKTEASMAPSSVAPSSVAPSLALVPQMTDAHSSHKELVIGYIGPGEFLGEVGLFFPSHQRHVSLRTRSAVEIAEIKHDRLLSLLSNELASDCPKILYAIGAHISKRLLSVTRKASGLAFVDVTERVMRSVVELAQQPEALTHPEGMQIKASRQELAKLSGCSREMAGRALKELEEAKRLTAHGKTIVVFGTR